MRRADPVIIFSVSYANQPRSRDIGWLPSPNGSQVRGWRMVYQRQSRIS